MKYLGSQTIETERLILKKQTMEEQQYLWSLLVKPEVNKYYLTVPKKYKEKLKDWYIQKEYYLEEMKYADNKDIFRWSVFKKDTNECIGRVSCHEANVEFEDINDPSIRGVGWFIDPKYQGKGYGYEAAKAMMDFMFEKCEIDEIRTAAAIENVSSWNIMEKFGFTRLDETKMVDYTYIDEPVKDYQYSLTKEEYTKQQKGQK